MQVQDIKKISDQALTALSESLELGQSETMIAYLSAMAKFHRYSFANILLIAAQRPGATQVAGFRTWQKFNRFVRKGEKGLVIYAPMRSTKQQTETEVDTTKPSSILRFRGVHVFDISQTDGEALPEATTIGGDPAGYTNRLVEYVRSTGIALAYADLAPSHFGYSSGGAITLRAGMEPAEEFATLVHEFAHEKLHHATDEPVRVTKVVRETEAEAVAFVVCHAIGLNTGTASSDYIKLYQGDAKILAASLDRIQKTATTILAAIEPAATPEMID